MQSFYLTNNKSKKNNFDILKKYLNDQQDIEFENFVLNFFFTKDLKSFYKINDNFIANLGTFIYKNKFNEDALRLFLNDLLIENDLKKLLLSDNCRGQFCLILKYNNEIKIISDRLGYYPMYIYKKNDTIGISNSMLLLAKNNKTSINNIGVAQYLSENYKHVTYACCDQNIFNEIKYLPAGTIISLKSNKIFENQYFNIKEHLEIGKFINFNQIVDSAEKILSENLSFLKNYEGKIHSDITGGVDTRVIIGLLSKLGIKFKVGVQAIKEYKDFSNYGKFSELNIVDKIISYKKLNFDIYTDEKYNKNSKLIDEITFLHSHKQTYNRRTGYFNDVKDSKAKILISGLSGTELLRLSYYKYFKNNSDLNYKSFFEEYVELVDIMHEKLMTKEKYYDHLKDFYEKNLSEVKYKEARDLSSYIDYFAFYRTHFCRYLSLANSFLPFYTPYGDYKFALFMYQVTWDQKKKFKIQRTILSKNDEKLASFYSTRGIPLATVTFKNFYKFSKMISNAIPQQYFNWRQQISTAIYKSIIRLSFKYKKIHQFFSKNKNSNTKNKKNLWNTPNDINIVKDLEEFIKDKKNAPVFELIDKNKLIKYTVKDCSYNVLNRVKSLSQILEFTKN